MKQNTLQKGSVRFIVFREKDTLYGICLEFNIVESGDTPQEAMLLLFEAAEGYLESVRRIKARPSILNQKPDPEYESLWDDLQGSKKICTKEAFMFSSLNVSSPAPIASRCLL